ncbi:MAG: TolC family protein [Rubrivivax sp.]|nr:TolC family protein [Rubrivivax sp.]
MALAAAAQASPAQTTALSLPEAIQQALAQNPQQLSQRLEIDRAGAARQAARAAKSPALDAGASATRYGYPTFVHGIREAGVFPPLDNTVVDLGLALKLPLYTGGRLAQGVVLADLGQQIARERERLGAQELTFNVSSVYFKIQQLDALAQVYAARIASLEAQLQRATLLRDAGKTGKLDPLRITTLLTKARHDRLQIENRGREAWTLLYQLAGVPRPAQAPALTRYVAAWAPDGSLEQLRQQAQAQRPELQIAQRQSSAGLAREEIARGEQRPTASLVSGLHERSGSSARFYGDWSVGVQLSMPLFDGGLRRARVDEAATARRQAELAAQQTQLEVDKQVEDAWNAHAEAGSRLRVTATGIAEAGEALAIETLKLEHGVGLVSDVLSAETALLGAQADRLQAQFDLITTRFGLLRATGALSLERVVTLVAPDTGTPDGKSTVERNKP